MITARTVTIVGIIVVLFSAGVFFYTEYSNRKFEASLPNPPQTLVAEPDETGAPVETFKENTSMDPRQATDTNVTDIQKREQTAVANTTETESELEFLETALENELVLAPEDSYEMS